MVWTIPTWSRAIRFKELAAARMVTRRIRMDGSDDTSEWEEPWCAAWVLVNFLHPEIDEVIHTKAEEVAWW